MSGSLGYFISFRTYGTWLHGDARGSVDGEHNHFRTPFVEPNAVKESSERERMSDEPVELTHEQRDVIAKTIGEVAAHYRWLVRVQNVRTNHVHVVVSAPGVSPARVMNAFKSWATRRLREAGLVQDAVKIWSRHGSTPHLYDMDALESAIHYVRDLQ